ncbi:MAG: hypothetical protein AAF730_16300 [Bacteroidota bacterium]
MPRILKAFELEPLDAAARPPANPLAQPRIQRAQVVWQAAPEAQPAEPDSYRLHGVLRRGRAEAGMEAVAVQLPAFEADFPLPEPLKRSLPEPTPPPTPEPEPEATALDAEREAEWEDRLEAEVAAARDAAFADGYAAAKAEAQDEHETWKSEQAERHQALLDKLVVFKNAWKVHLEKSEQPLLRLALTAAKAITEVTPAHAQIKAAERALRQAVGQLAGEAPVEICTHPVDYLRLQELGVVDRLDELFNHLTWTPDALLSEGDWIVQTTDQAIRRLQDELYANLKAELLAGLETADAETQNPA